MITHRCRNCIWWDNVHPSIKDVPLALAKSELGFCRKHKPGGVKLGSWFYGIQPVTDADEFCGEFKA